MKVYPVGYAAPGSMERIEELLKDEQTYLVDIRKRAQSRYRPQWNKGALIAKFGAQYIHVPELGNVNYRQVDRHKGIVLVDPDAGLARLIDELQRGRNLILLCACQQYEHCHRRVVVELLQERMPEGEIILPGTMIILLPRDEAGNIIAEGCVAKTEREVWKKADDLLSESEQAAYVTLHRLADMAQFDELWKPKCYKGWVQ